MSKAADYFWVAVLVVVGVGILTLVGLIVVPRIKEILPGPGPAATLVPGISSVSEEAPRPTISVQPFIAEEIERISKGKMDVLHVEEQGDFAVVLVIWVKGDLTEAQGAELDTLLASEYAIARLVYAQYVPQLDNMVFVIYSAYDCIAMGDLEMPVRCVPDESVTPGYLVPDDGLDLLND